LPRDVTGLILSRNSTAPASRAAPILLYNKILMEKENNWRPAALALTVFGVISRLVPHPWNFTPVGSASLFSGARLPGWQAYLIPLAIMAITDPILNAVNHVPLFSYMQLFIYFSFALSVVIGRRLWSTESVPRIGLASLINSTQFFLITNFGVWMVGPAPFAHTAAGLGACYVVAMPFFAYTIFGDLFFAGAIFGLHAWLSRTTVARQERVLSQA